MISRNKVLLFVYAILCLLLLPALVRWNGQELRSYLLGVVYALAAFAIPILFTLLFAAIFTKLLRLPFVEGFNSSLTVIVIFCCILVGYLSCGMLTVSP